MKHTSLGIRARPESSSLASWPPQAKNIRGKSSRESQQSNAHCSAIYQPLKNPPKIYIAKPIYLDKHLPANSKQFRYKQGPPQHPSISRQI